MSSEPSANWVMILPDETLVELFQKGGVSEGSGSGVVEDDGGSSSTANTNPAVTSPDPDDDNAFVPSSQVSVSSSFPKESRSRSSGAASSTESSVDTESSWGIHSLLGKFLDMTGFKESLNSAEMTTSRGGGGGVGGGASGGREDDIIRREPGQSLDERRNKYRQAVQEGTYRKQFHEERTGFCLPERTLTPKPVSSQRGEEGGEEGGAGEHTKPSHKRTATWHSETEFTKSPNELTKKSSSVRHMHRVSKYRTPAYVFTPRMCANLRVQPHPFGGVSSRKEEEESAVVENSSSAKKCWCHERLFDIFVHPSSLPEAYQHLRGKKTIDSFLVEVVPLCEPNRYIPKTTESAVKLEDASESESLGYDNGHGNTSGSTARRQGSAERDLPSSLVVRLCFATRLLHNGDTMKAVASDPLEPEHWAMRDKMKEGVEEVAVEVGHVVVSDLVRQQLAIRECSPVKVLHVMDSWKISYADGIKIVLHPLEDKVCV